jgi:peptide/nickel transport system substrate-binding protein
MSRSRFPIRILISLLAVILAGCTNSANPVEKILRVALPTDLEVMDPSWTPTYVTRDHGFMIYDTLFGLDELRNIQPQMVDHYETSEDQKTWTFTLRDGLEFHDGVPVTSDDVIASIKRWSQKDTLGKRLVDAVSEWQVVNSKSFRMKLKTPYRLVLESFAKPDSFVPFIYPKRLAEISPERQITDMTGSGPFIYKKEESKPGETLVYVRNPRYKPRSELASGTAGGKFVKIDRVELRMIKDPQTRTNALISGTIDMIIEPPYTQYPSIKADPDVRMVAVNPLGYFFYLRFNHIQSPFNNPAVRQAAMAALNQPEFLHLQVGIPGVYSTCFSIYPCDTAFANEMGMDFISNPDPKRAHQLLDHSGYDGKPVVILQAVDHSTLNQLPLVAAQQLRQAGFNVELKQVDFHTWQILRGKRDGWSIFLSYSSAWSNTAPISMNLLSASGDMAWYGWPSDPPLEKLRDAFSVATDDYQRHQLATLIQVRAMEAGIFVPLGEIRAHIAARKNINGFVTGPINALWNIVKD